MQGILAVEPDKDWAWSTEGLQIPLPFRKGKPRLPPDDYHELRRLAKGLRYRCGLCFALLNRIPLQANCFVFCIWRKLPPDLLAF